MRTELIKDALKRPAAQYIKFVGDTPISEISSPFGCRTSFIGKNGGGVGRPVVDKDAPAELGENDHE